MASIEAEVRADPAGQSRVMRVEIYDQDGGEAGEIYGEFLQPDDLPVQRRTDRITLIVDGFVWARGNVIDLQKLPSGQRRIKFQGVAAGE